LNKKYKVGDTIYAKGKVKEIDSGDEYLPYKVKFEDNSIDSWLSKDSILEPPAKPTIPKGVADEIEDYKLKGFDLIDYFTSFNECAADVKNSSKYMCDNTDKINNQRVANLANAWNYGYTVDKPKLYNLVLGYDSDNNDGGTCNALNKRGDGLFIDICSLIDDDLKSDPDYQFTQEEIDKYNKNFWIKNIDLNDYKVVVPTDEE